MNTMTQRVRLGLAVCTAAVALAGAAHAQGQSPGDPVTKPGATPGTGDPSGGAIAPGSAGTKGVGTLPRSASSPDAPLGATNTGGARREASPINQPALGSGKTRRPATNGLSPGDATNNLPSAPGGQNPAIDSNGGGGTLGHPGTGAGSIRPKAGRGATGASN
jgi:hypothetical protein